MLQFPQRRLCMLIVAALAFCDLTTTSAAAADAPATSSARTTSSSPAETGQRVPVYRLESVEIRGSDRISAEQLVEQLGLRPGMPLNDTVVMNTRQHILSLGLFRSAVLLMRKGSQRGLAKLIVEVEDDHSVLTSWAWGAEVGVTHGEAQAASADPDSPPLGYRLRLVSRNLFKNLYRGDIFADVDADGILRAARVAAGLPRFASEDVQFDVELAAVDVTRRYLDAMLFAGRLNTIWTSTAGDYSELQYGVSMFVNRPPRFGYVDFPTSLAGPRISYSRETRLQRFFPGAGYRTQLGLTYTPIQANHSVVEAGLAKTFDLWSMGWLTMQVDSMAIGAHGLGVRAETRLDVPLISGRSSNDQALLFVRLRGGLDDYKDKYFQGAAGLFGLRYHSSGLIAELVLQITKSPREFLEEDLPGIKRGDL